MMATIFLISCQKGDADISNEWSLTSYVKGPGEMVKNSGFYLKIEFAAGTERTFRISGFDLDNAAQPSSASEGNHSNHTAAYIDFTIPADAGVATSPDIKTIVQEVVNRSGWSSGNAMMLGLWMSTTQSDDYNRTFNTGHDSGDTAPKLEITYS